MSSNLKKSISKETRAAAKRIKLEESILDIQDTIANSQFVVKNEHPIDVHVNNENNVSISVTQINQILQNSSEDSDSSDSNNIVEVENSDEFCVASDAESLASQPNDQEENNSDTFWSDNGSNGCNLYYNNLEDDLPPILETDSESESEVNEPIPVKKQTIAEKIVLCLRKSASLTELKQSAINVVLKTMREDFPEDFSSLPKDARTVLKTPRNVKVDPMGDGKFVYLGLAKYLREFLDVNKVYAASCNKLDLLFNVDGLPLFNSARIQSWPILCKIFRVKVSPFPVAIFCGTSKPPLEEFLEQFIIELKQLLAEGLLFNGKIISVHVVAFICDAPAKSFLKCVKNHNAYYGCDRCYQKGTWKGRVVFLEPTASKISDKAFAEQKFSNLHVGVSPLLELKIGLTSTFPIDFMHMAVLGVIRRLLFLWRDGTGYHKPFFSHKLLAEFNEKILTIKEFWPSDFNRKPRSLGELERWKATELRSFLLYYGPVILKKYLPDNVYHNFLCFHVAISILVNENYNKLYNDYADKLLNIFVLNMGQIYGEEILVYNSHGLLHLASDAKRLGNLDSFSAFPFENYLGQMKRLLRNANNPVCQMVKRLEEQSSSKFSISSEGVTRVVENSKIKVIDVLQSDCYSVAYVKNQRFANDKRDRAFLLKNGSVFILSKIVKEDDELKLVGNIILNPLNFFNYPLESKKLCIFKYYSISGSALSAEKIINICDIKCKGCLLPQRSNFIFYPLH